MAGSWLSAAAAAARREMAALRARPRELLMLSVLPVVSWGFFLALLAPGSPADLPVSVVDLDHSALSRRLARAIDAAPSMRVAEIAASTDEAARGVREGRTYAIVSVPAEFERDVLRGRAPTVVVDYNAQWLLPGSLVRRDARAAAGDVAAGTEAAGRRARGERLAGVEPVVVDARPLFNPQLNYAHFLLPALLPTMLQIFVLLQTVATVGRELRRRTAHEWLATAGGRSTAALAGKLLLPAAWFTLLAAAMLVTTFRVAGAPMRGHWPVVVTASATFVLAYQAIGVLLVTWTANLRLATSLAAFYAGAAFAFAGVTFPLSGMPWTARAWAGVLPLTHYVSLAFEQAMRAAPIAESLPELGALVLLAAVPLALALPRLGPVMRDERFWGRL